MMRTPLFGSALFLFAVTTLGACGGGGGDAKDSSQWVGKSFLLTVPADNWTDPKGIGGDIGDFVPQFLFGVTGGSGKDLTITIGTATAGAQNPCSPTTAVTASGATYPMVQIDAPQFPMHIVDTNQTPTVVVDTTIHDLTFTNVLPGGAAKAGTVVATIDAAEVYPLFRLIPNPTKDSVCQALGSAGAACTTCAHNGQPYCLTIKAVQIEATASATPAQTVSAGALPASCASP